MSSPLFRVVLLLGWVSPLRADDRLPTEGRCSPGDEPEIILGFLDDARLLLEAGDALAAERKYRATLGVITQRGLPGVHRVRGAVGIARSRVAQGDAEGALRALDELEYLGHHCIAEEQALILLETDPEKALELLREARTSPWASWSEKGRLVMRHGQILMEDEPSRAAAVLHEERGFLGYWLAEAPASEVDRVLDISARLWEDRWNRESVGSGDRLDPLEPDALIDLAVQYGHEEHREAAELLLEEIREVRAIETADSLVPGWGLTGPFERADGIRRRLDNGELDPALVEAKALADEQPNAETLGLLGDVYWARGQGHLASLLYEQAAGGELVPGEWHSRWVLHPRTEQSEVPELRIQYLERASLSLQPSPEILIRLARAYRNAGRDSEARQRFLEAASLLEALPGTISSGTLGEVEDELYQLDVVPAPGAVLPKVRLPSGWEETGRAIRVSWSMAASGRLELSQRAFQRAERLAPEPEALDAIRGALAWLSGDEDEAIRAWTQSLAWDPSQRILSLHLGQLYMNRGELELAHQSLTQAGEQGLIDAYVFLARLEISQGRDGMALQHIERYQEGPIGRSAYRAEVAALASNLQSQPHELPADAPQDRVVLLVLVLMGLALGFLWWRGRRTDLRSILEEFPESGHDMARILSAIRHEVLKHNTTLLDEIADALENGDHHAVSFAAIRLFGMPDGQDGGIPVRFEGYLRALEGIGSRYRRRLEIRRSDEVLGPMCEAMDELQALEPALRRPWRAGPRVPGQLRRLSRTLNETGYRALGGLLQQMGTLTLARSFIEEVDTRVQSEPAFADVALPDLEIRMPEATLSLRIFHGDLQDILANLLRNALRAGIDSAALGVSIRVEEEEDPITGVEHVAIRVLDRAPDRLRTGFIRGRSIGRGLGLVTDLLARHEGTLEVEHREDEMAQGWSKALVLRLRRMEVES